jgi:hypothetical protein
VGALNTEFIDKVINNFLLDWRKKIVTRSSDVVPEQMLEFFCIIYAGEMESVLFNNAVEFLSLYRPGPSLRDSDVWGFQNL